MADLLQGNPNERLDVQTRLDDLQRQVEDLNREIAHLRGQLLNVDPLLGQTLERKNQDLRKRLTDLEKTQFALLQDAGMARTGEEETLQKEILRQAAVEHFKKQNIDTLLWKNLES